MLQGLDQTMTEDGLIDLVAYLDSMEQALATVHLAGADVGRCPIAGVRTVPSFWV